MKLGDRVTIIVVAVMLASFGFHYLIQRLIYVPSFDSLEKEQIGSDIRRSV